MPVGANCSKRIAVVKWNIWSDRFGYLLMLDVGRA